jgi:acetyl esterase/lipase
MIMGDSSVGLSAFLDIIEKYGFVVVSPEYRLAPEDPHPAPIEDCYAGLEWMAAHASELAVDPGRLLVAGASAGGGLAAGTALLARDQSGPALIGQILLCPMLDDRNDSISSRQFSGVGMWDRESNQLGWSALLGDRVGQPGVSAYAASSRAVDFSNLPPAFIEVGSAEVFRDESVAYASALWAAGGIADLHVWAGGFHGFRRAPDATITKGAAAATENWLQRILGQPA